MKVLPYVRRPYCLTRRKSDGGVSWLKCDAVNPQTMQIGVIE